MTDENKIELPPLPALPLPDGTLYGPDRTVRGHPFLPPKVRTYALGYGQLCLDIAQAQAAQRIAGLRGGNTSLLEHLMAMVNQVGLVDPDFAVVDRAKEALSAAGMLDDRGDPDWAALAARKGHPTEAPT